MGMRIRMQPSVIAGLCGTCRHGVVLERSTGASAAYCDAMSADALRVPSDVTRCSRYDDRRLPSEWEMQKIAWTLKHDKGGRVIGFAPPEKAKEGE